MTTAALWIFIAYLICTPPYPTASEAQAIQLINEFRAQQSIEQFVIPDSASCAFARKRAKDIQTDFSHDGFKGQIKDFYGDRWKVADENLARNFSTPEQVVTAWTRSPSHRKVLLAQISFLCVAQQGRYWSLEGWQPKEPSR